MNFKDMLVALRAIQDQIQAKYSLLDKKTFVLARVAKMTEELGEFANEILSSLGLQRQDKLEQYAKWVSH